MIVVTACLFATLSADPVIDATEVDATVHEAYEMPVETTRSSAGHGFFNKFMTRWSSGNSAPRLTMPKATSRRTTSARKPARPNLAAAAPGTAEAVYFLDESGAEPLTQDQIIDRILDEASAQPAATVEQVAAQADEPVASTALPCQDCGHHIKPTPARPIRTLAPRLLSKTKSSEIVPASADEVEIIATEEVLPPDGSPLPLRSSQRPARRFGNFSR